MKTTIQFLKMMLIAVVICCGVASVKAQGNFFLSGKVILGGGPVIGVPNWNVKAVEILAPTNIYTATTDLDGFYDIVIPNGGFIGPNKRWEVSIYDSCSMVLRKDTVQNSQGFVSSETLDFVLNQCQKNSCGIGWQYTENNQAVTFFSSAFGAPNGTTRYLWVFGDGTTSTDKNPTHFYQPGTYGVCAWVFSKSAGNDYCLKVFCNPVIVNPIGNTNPNCNTFEDQVITVADKENAFNLYGNGNSGFLSDWRVTSGTPSLNRNGFISGLNAYDGSQYALVAVCNNSSNSSEGLSLNKTFQQGKSYEVTIAIRNSGLNGGSPIPIDVDFLLLKNQITYTYQSQVGCSPTPAVPTDAINVKSITSFANNSWQLLTFTITNLQDTYEHLWIRNKFSANSPLVTTLFLFDNLCIKDITPKPCYSFEEQVITTNDREHAFNLYGNGNPGFLDDWNVVNGTPSIYRNGDLSGVDAYDGNQFALTGVCGAANSSEGVSLTRNFGQGKSYEVTIAIRNFRTGGNPTPLDIDFVLLKNKIAFNYQTQTGCTQTPVIPTNSITVKSINSFAQNNWQLVTFSITNLTDNYEHLWIRPKFSANAPLATTFFLFDNLCIEEVVTACQSYFTYNNNGINLLTVAFQNQSTHVGGSASYSWNFGDSTATSNDVNPAHAFAQYGTYNVCLTISTPNNCTNTFCKQVTVQANPFGCEAAFQAIPVANNRVEIVNNSVSDNPNSTSYVWLWGDNSSGSGLAPDHTYPTAGTYTICMYQYDAVSGCRDTLCKVVQVGNNSVTCNANFGIISSTPNTLTLIAPATVTFKDSSVSNTSGTGIAAWLWKVNGNNVDTTQNPTYNFTQSGTYNVCLIITTTNGCTDDYCKQITVLPATNCAIIFNESQSPNSNQVSFQSTTTSSNASAQPVSYQWTFGDGTGSPDANPVHAYTAADSYYVCVQVAFTDGCTAQKCDSVYVNNTPIGCEASFVFDNSGLNITTYTFYDSSATYTLNNPIVAWEWQVDNTVKSTQQNFTYTFTSFDTYVVCLKITTLNGCTDTYCKTITVGNNVNCDANFTAAKFSGIPNKIQFTNTSLPSPTPAGTFFYWNFGDGSPVTQAVSPNHTYSQAGVYTVCMYLFNQNVQCYDTICKQVTVGNTNTNCVASFIYTVNGNAVTFNNTSSPGFNTNSFFWTFGDSTTSTNKNPTHTYSSPGTYQVCLTIISANSNCTNSVCKTIVIGQSNSLHCISGKVFKGTPNSIAYPARVVLIYQDDIQGTLTAIRYATTGVNGGYEFCNVPNGKYLVKAFLTPNDPQYSNYLPTYYGNSLFWNYATHITLTTQNIQQVDIWLIAGNNQGGPGFVGGYVLQGANKQQAPGDELQDVQVMLLDMFDNPVQYIFTDEAGRWTFDNVAYGTYQIYAEVPGKETIPYIVTISEQQPNADNILLFVESEQVISGVSELRDILSSGLSIFPNPTNNKFFIETNLQQQATINISLTDIAGKVIVQEVANVLAGSATHGISIANEKSGMYILKVEHNGFSKIFKLMKY